jgi:hypothetical protein
MLGALLNFNEIFLNVRTALCNAGYNARKITYWTFRLTLDALRIFLRKLLKF